jgi:hypothetical protein
MATLKLTDRVVKGKKPPAEGYLELWDSNLPGFGLRIGFGGKRSFQVMARVHGDLVRHKLGTYPTMTLAQAHQEARRVFREAQAGIKPKTRRRRRHWPRRGPERILSPRSLPPTCSTLPSISARRTRCSGR